MDNRNDNVNKPPHYQLRKDYEVYDLRQDLAAKAADIKLPHNQYSDWDRCLEYLLRAPFKNKEEDLKKGRWYLNQLIQKMESEKKELKADPPIGFPSGTTKIPG